MSKGYFVESELVAVSGDCNDADVFINPGATEICGDGPALHSNYLKIRRNIQAACKSRVEICCR